MVDLFGDLPVVPGFEYLPDFLSDAEETDLLALLLKLPLHPFQFHGYEARRNVESFGCDYSFDDNRLRPGKPIPESFMPLIRRVATTLGIDVSEIRELLVTEYPEGAQINWPRDAFPFEIIAGVSLLSDCTFRFRPFEKAKQGRKSIRSQIVGRRSLYVMRDEARTQWQHSILPVSSRRYSITLRTLRVAG